MSNSIFGNNGIGEYHTDMYEVELEDDDGETYETTIEGDYVREIEFVGYTFTAEENSKNATVNMYYYHRAPTSKYYWDMMYGDPSYPVFPIVVVLNKNNTATELLNTSFPVITLSEKSNGWYSVTVPLKRKIKTGDYIYFGFGGAIITPVYDEMMRFPTPETPYNAYFSNTINFDYSKFHETVPKSLLAGKLLNEFTLYWEDGKRFSVYMTYENEPNSQEYKITISGNANIGTSITRKSTYKRTSKNTITNSEYLNRKSVLKKSIKNDVQISSLINRVNNICFTVSSEFLLKDVNRNNRILKRLITASKTLTSEIKSGMLFFRGITDDKDISDETLRHLLIKRSGIELIILEDKIFRLFSFSRSIETSGNVEMILTRITEAYRNTYDEVPVTAKGFASRLFFRTCTTVMSMWDFIKGKIRETNNIVSLYCHIDLEIEIEAHI